ncbi:pyridoxamine 5'-phosphate oxidase [Basilea psittacipulmonis]|uniref:Pyridoxine/pyridoxamine 5'-phosphate oxidase n=1 Tax=Basilea psittacipulmonis DSM 24701 TaxID=1072685 RepID=A0A077DEM0_9BURK|nr:pyridoxamine 5'-phosphate oxidase [Basilea psittacipulmonis]AIL33179.1 hypothetical protein IX83_07625 [Basilea psittacipulmonis DSM 24701]
MSYEDLRQHYDKDVLNESGLLANPIEQFEKWFQEAMNANILEPNAMVISTVSPQGVPSARTILCKGVSDQGFRFFTNYDSKKGKDLQANPYVSALFVWLEMQRQVQIIGRVQKISEEESTAYFHKRPVASQIGAWASPQSQVITREALEKREREFQEKFGEDVPKPAHWGGYLIVPEQIEFWQGRPSRLHDRILYTKSSDGWHHARLAP